VREEFSGDWHSDDELLRPGEPDDLPSRQARQHACPERRGQLAGATGSEMNGYQLFML